MRRILVIVLASSTASACNTLSGLQDLGVSPGSNDASGVSRDASDAPDGGSDASVPAPPPACSCVPAPPSDWNGPVALLAARGDAPRECPIGLVAMLKGGVDPGASPPCSPCQCGPPTGTCTTRVQSSSGSSCTNVCATKDVGATCTSFTFCAPTASAVVTTTLTGGSCAPSGGGKTAAAWARRGTTCTFDAPANAGCPAGQACAPKSDGAPDAKTCLTHDGDVPCPLGAYTERDVYYADVLDTRACSACTCGAAVGTCSQGTVTLYRDTFCATPTATASANCQQFNTSDPNGSAKLTTPGTLIDGSCTPSESTLSGGGLAAAKPTTVCCIP